MKRKAPFFLILGIFLVALSLCFAVIVQLQLRTGAKTCQTVIAEMENLLPERTSGILGSSSNSGMPVLEINGADYVAILEIPAFGITLPVADNWSSAKLSRSPARFSGSVYDKALVIGGADYPRQFDFCDEIAHGDMVIITDMTGARFSYSVSRIDRASRAEAQWLENAAYDLTLFCRNTFSMEYLAVRCISSTSQK